MCACVHACVRACMRVCMCTSHCLLVTCLTSNNFSILSVLALVCTVCSTKHQNCKEMMNVSTCGGGRHTNGGNRSACVSMSFCSPVVPPLPSKKTLVPFIVQGATAVLRFTTTNTPYPPLYYVWTKDGMEITEGNKYTVLDDGVLQISDFSLADEGLYLCIGSNKYSEAERSFYPKTSEIIAIAGVCMCFLVYVLVHTRACVRACVRVCVRACVRVCVCLLCTCTLCI